MKIENLSELSKLLDLCRKKGVSSIIVDGINLQLTDHAPVQKARGEALSVESDPSNPNWEDLSPEEQMFYSAGGMPLQPSKE